MKKTKQLTQVYDNNNKQKTKHRQIKKDDSNDRQHITMNKFNKEGLNWFGDKLQLRDDWHTGEYSATMRICSININGISKEMKWLEWENLLKDIRRVAMRLENEGQSYPPPPNKVVTRHL